jgi:DNA-binding FadR family transcriptional regulator
MNSSELRLKIPQQYEMVVARLKKLIQDGVLQPGSRLPAERELSSELGVGRGTIREAIGELVNQGVVQTRPNSGTYVLENAIHTILDLADVEPHGDTGPDATLAARIEIEPIIAKFAAAVGRRDKEIESLLEQMEAVGDLTDPENRRKWNEHDRAFHLRIAMMTANPVMISIAQMFNDIVDEPLWRQLRDRGIHDHARARLYVYDHRLIYEAIATGNVEAAQFYVRQHLERVQADMV